MTTNNEKNDVRLVSDEELEQVTGGAIYPSRNYPCNEFYKTKGECLANRVCQWEDETNTCYETEEPSLE